MRKPKFIRRILDRLINFELDCPKTEPPVGVAPMTRLRGSDTTPSKRKFPILQLPFVAQKHVLWMLELKDLIPLSLLSKRSKRMIKEALPFKKAQYDCTVLSREVPTIKITSRFGSYTGFEPYVDHIIEVLSYPPIGVVIDVESAMTKAARWIKTHHHCVKEVLFSTPPLHPGMSTKFVNPRFELNTQLDGDMVTVCSQDEIRIENPDLSLMYYIWGLKCRRLRLTSERFYPV
ncbi:unnamed protein product [Caenorhabditis brenneri]